MKSYKKIILGIDLNHFSVGTMVFAAETAEMCGASLIVIYAHKSYLPIVNVSLPKGTIQRDEAEYKEELEELCKKHIPPVVAWETVVIEGRPIYQTIIRAAKKLEADLIIVGEQDRHSLDEILIGSNTEKIVRYAPCSVYVLKNR